MLAALAEGPSEIAHFSAAADCRSTLDCFSQLGVKIDIQGDRVRIAGADRRHTNPSCHIDSEREYDSGKSFPEEALR